MGRANKLNMCEIDTIVEHMSGDKKEIYNFFNRPNFKNTFKNEQIIECLKEKKEVPPASAIDSAIKQSFKETLLKIKYNPEPKRKFKKEKDNDELNSFQFLKDENYRLYKFYSNLANEYKNKIREEIFKMFNIQPTGKKKKEREIEMSEYIEKFNCVCDGEGEELRKISLLTSSSLCAFLCFYKVSEKNPLYIKLDKKLAIFTKSIFEWKNPLYGEKASNIDVVLVGKYVDEPKQNVVYFIESKFSEYYRTSDSCIVPIYYINDKVWRALYDDKNLKKLGLIKIPLKSKQNFLIKELSGEPKQFLEGVQQMFRHFIGINNLLCGKKEYNFGKHLDLKNADIYLGTVIFQITSNAKPTKAYSNYQKLETMVASNLNYHLDKVYGKEEGRQFKKVLYPKIYQNIFTSSKECQKNLKNLTEEIKVYYDFK